MKDVGVFAAAQSDFLKFSQALFVDEKLDIGSATYFTRKILEWCQRDIRSVAYRSGKVEFVELLKHVRLIWTYCRFFWAGLV